MGAQGRDTGGTLAIVLAINSLVAGFLLGHGWCRLTSSRIRVEIVSGVGPGLRREKPSAENLAKPGEVDDDPDHAARDGMTLEKDGHFAVFLPQVAPEQGWDLPTTLSYLAQKAGLPKNAWRDGAAFETFQAEVFHE